MTSDELHDLEVQALLRASGELAPSQCEALAATTEHDAEAADFARFVEHDLRSAARAPRDFASEAIAASLDARAPRDFAAEAIAIALPKRRFMTKQRMWAAAAAVVFIAISLHFIHDTRQPMIAATTTPTPRTTVAISQRLDDLEADLSLARSRFSVRRYPPADL